jgi:hypothetical protein
MTDDDERSDEIHAYYASKDAAFKEAWSLVTEAIKRGAPAREIEALKRKAESAGYTGD